MAKINGNNGNNTLLGTYKSDIVHGLKGDDSIKGLGGDDWLYGDAGNDVLDGGAGNDHIYGGTGSDDLIGGTGKNDLWGGGGTSTQNAHQDNYYLTGGKANSDTIHISKGDSTFQLNAFKIPINFDRVYGMDKFDKIDLPSKTVMKDIKLYDAPSNIGDFDKFTIKNGVITLQDSNNHTIKIDNVFLAGEAYKFITKNCLPINLDKFVALQVDVTYPPVNYKNYGDYGHNANPTHTVLLEAHSGPKGESITAIDIIGNLTSTISHQIIQDSHIY